MNKAKENLLIVNEADEQEVTLMESDNEVSSDILFEDTSKRSENVKHFRMKNGQYVAAVYDKPVHSLDKATGKFVDIAHHFDEKDDCYEAETDRFKACFPKKEGKRKFVTIEKDGRSISWRYIPSTDSHKKRPEAAIHKHERVSLMELPSFPTLKYEKTESRTDLEYGITDRGVKENIILSKRPKNTTFRFELKLKGLRAVLTEDKKAVQLFADDEENSETEFIIPLINMMDDAGVYSEAAHYELSESENGTVLSIVVDPEWLLSDERIYPVTIDPQVLIEHVYDTDAYSFVGITSEGERETSTGVRRVGHDKKGTERRIYSYIELPVLPDGYKITGASFVLHQYGYSGDGEFELYKITKSWNSNSISWSNQPSVASAPSAKLKSQNRSVSYEIELDISNDITSWYKKSGEGYYGYAIKASSNNKTSSYVCNCKSNIDNYIEFYSNAKNNGYSPAIRVKYTLVDEYADHQEHENFSVGRAGDGAINLFTGNLTFIHNDVTAIGGNLPLELSHVFRSDYAELNGATYGQGWIISAAQTLTTSNSVEVVAIYRDAKGRKHYFTEKRVTDCGETVYDDSAGLGFTLSEPVGDKPSIIDDKGNCLTFANGKLIKISDANNNNVTLTYEGNLLTIIEDSIGRKATLKYNDKKLVSITDVKNRTISYTYSGDKLTSITYPDNSVTTFAYDSSARLNKITDQTGITYELVYTGGKVTSVTRKGTKTVARNNIVNTSAKSGGGITITYYNTSTVVENQLTHVRAVYRFDDCGRVTCAYDDLTKNSSLKKSEITVTDLREYKAVLNRETGNETKSRYASVKVGISGAEESYPNLLSNGWFTNGTSGWTITGSGSVSSSSYWDGKKSYCFNASSSQKLSQTVNVNSCNVSGNVFIASAWAKASKPNGGTFKLYAKMTYENGDTLEREALYDRANTGWQYVAVPLMIEPGKKPASVLVRFDCSGSGTSYVTNLRLVETRGLYTKINYKVGGSRTVFGTSQSLNRTVYTTNGLQGRTICYNKRSDAVEIDDSDENGYLYKSYAAFDDKHQPTRTKDYRNVESAHSYDDFGNEWWRRSYASDDPDTDLSYVSKYNDKTSRLEYVYDPRSKDYFSRYTYDSQAELITQKVDYNGQAYNYGYSSKTDLQTSINSPTNCGVISDSFQYDARYLTQVTHNAFNFDFAYDELGRNSSIKVRNKDLVTFVYADAENSTVTARYANGSISVVTYDSYGNPIRKTIDGKTVLEAEYDGNGTIKKLVDKLQDICYTYTYNKDGNVARIDETNTSGSSQLGYQTFTYDEGLRLVSCYDSRIGITEKPVYELINGRKYPDNAIVGTECVGKYTDKIERDGIRRAASRKLTLHAASSPLMTDTYGYLKSNIRGGDEWKNKHETTYVGSLTQSVNGKSATLTYTYDRLGNVESISDSTGMLVKYTYDVLNRLSQEDNYKYGRRYCYTYDNGGNITARKEVALTSGGATTGSETVYTYSYDSSWKDLLTSYNKQSITYDDLGNPTTYRDNSLSWTNVRQLAKYGSNTFSYNANGIRYKKNNTTYTLNESKILKESDGTKTITYYYGNSGVIGFNYNGTSYYYKKNLQDDVTAIYNASGTLVAEYLYDAWGKVLTVTNHTSANIGTLNPFRYRSYYYDTETGLYYLQTRYYDPETGRFINSDSHEYLGEGKELVNYNLFAYCSNNPVMGTDYEGTKTKEDKPTDCQIAENPGGVAAGVSLDKIAGSGGGGDKSRNRSVISPYEAQAKIKGPVTTTVKQSNNGYTPAAKKGIEMHAKWDYGPGVKKEVTIGPGARVDGYDLDNRIIYELKPNNPRAIKRGNKQLERYLNILGPEWKGILVTYD